MLVEVVRGTWEKSGMVIRETKTKVVIFIANIDNCFEIYYCFDE
jgi:hypothetical protein